LQKNYYGYSPFLNAVKYGSFRGIVEVNSEVEKRNEVGNNIKGKL
jgi:hypothetical protein